MHHLLWCRNFVHCYSKINVQKYINIPDNHLLPDIVRNQTYRFQGDNAPVHRTRITTENKQQNNIPKFWPAQSPDINNVKNLLYSIKRKLQIQAREISIYFRWNS